MGNCKVDYSNVQKKYNLSNNVFYKYRITVWAFVSFILLMWGRNLIFQIMFSANMASHCRHFSLLFWCGEGMWSMKLVFAVNIESQCRKLQGLLWNWFTLGTTIVFCNFSFLWTLATCFFRFSLHGALWQQSFPSLFFKSSCPIIHSMICFLVKSVKLRYSEKAKNIEKLWDFVQVFWTFAMC